MDIKTILTNSRHVYVNAVIDARDLLDSYNDYAQIPEMDIIISKFNNLITDYDKLVESAIYFIDNTEIDMDSTGKVRVPVEDNTN